MVKRIIVAGSMLVDHIRRIDRYPASGELVQIRDSNYDVGGLVPNVGRDLKRLDSSLDVLAIGKVGDDPDGDFIGRKLSESGVKLHLRISKTEPTSFTEVMSVSGGERTFFTASGANADWGYEDFPFEEVHPGDMVLLGYFLLLEKIDAGDGLRILKELKRLGAVTAIDLVTEDSERYIKVCECLPFVDYLIVNEVEASRLCGKQDGSEALARSLIDYGVREAVVIHEPGKGTMVRRGGMCSTVPSFAVPEGFIKDKTGAGDAFCAGVLTGIVAGASDAEILRRGALAAVGALSAEGASEGVRDFATLERMVG